MQAWIGLLGVIAGAAIAQAAPDLPVGGRSACWLWPLPVSATGPPKVRAARMVMWRY